MLSHGGAARQLSPWKLSSGKSGSSSKQPVSRQRWGSLRYIRNSSSVAAVDSDSMGSVWYISRWEVRRGFPACSVSKETKYSVSAGHLQLCFHWGNGSEGNRMWYMPKESTDSDRLGLGPHRTEQSDFVRDTHELHAI